MTNISYIYIYVQFQIPFFVLLFSEKVPAFLVAILKKLRVQPLNKILQLKFHEVNIKYEQKTKLFLIDMRILN